MAETKKCEVCEQEIGASEKVCPKCGTDFDALEENIKALETTQAVLTKRKEATEPPPAPEPKPKPKRSIFRSLTKEG